LTSNTFLLDLLVLLFARLPYVAALAMGLIVAIVRRRQAPRAMRLVAIGCALALMSAIGSQVFYAVMPTYFNPSSIMVYYQFSSIVFGLVSAAGFVLILFGAFAERAKVEARGFAVLTDAVPISRATPPPVPDRDHS
jgi:hypothetical protein